MASIDKTYITDIQQYRDFINWAKNKKFTTPLGFVLSPMNSLYYIEDINDETSLIEALKNDKSVPILNTSDTMDYYLIKYCPLDFIQNRMKEVYGEDYYLSIKNGASVYDTFKRESGTKVKVIKESKFGTKDFLDLPHRPKIVNFWIEVEHPRFTFSYHENKNIWTIDGKELAHVTSDVAHKKITSKRAMIKQILKWKLPKGSVVKWMGTYVGDDIYFKVY